jgi:tryptophan 2,3-dioxygenase
MTSRSTLTYRTHLRLSALLDQQVPQCSPPVHDELQFITIHQVYELWFKLVLYELSDARDRMLVGETYVPRMRLQRCHAIERVLVDQIDVLDTMMPQDFLKLRNGLGAASAFQSVQFREIEFLSGLKDSSYLERMRWLSASEHARLQRRLTEPSLWDGFLAVLAKSGFDVSTLPRRFTAYAKIAHDCERYSALWELAEALVEHDQRWSLWRSRHVLTAERQIGRKPGTGGSAGGAYLKTRIDLRFYPELWELRSMLGSTSQPQTPTRTLCVNQ